MTGPVAFICNVCGAHNRVEHFATEPPSCACGSNVRVRALIHLLSLELFGESLVLAEFPKLKAIRGLGIADHEGYAGILAEKFDYTNTYIDREPRFNLIESHPQLAGTYDFILAADVIEHIAPPVERAMDEACRLLKPSGFWGITIFCNPADQMREHFPGLNEFRVVALGDSTVLVNRRPDGTLEVTDENLIFHGGHGVALEMREFGISALRDKLLGCGFREVSFFNEEMRDIGVLFDHDVSQPLIARKDPFVMNPAARRQMVNLWRTAEGRADEERERAELLVKHVSGSRWMRMGRRLGLGPKLG